jgi:threonine/homoserine/homoserine lactone efflux protein
MDIVNLLTFVLVATLLVISPGPNGVLIANTVPLYGRKSGFANIWGFVAAFYLHGTLSIFGISVLLVQSAQAFTIFKLLEAAYLCWIGVKSLLSVWKSQGNPELPSSKVKRGIVINRGAFIQGFLTNALNPKVSMFYLAAFPQFISAGESAYKAYFLVSAHAVINLVWFSVMVVLLSHLKMLAGNAGFTKWIKSVTGVAFIGFGAKLAFWRP